MSTIKTVWQMSGEKEYKQALSDINRGIGVLDSEMKKVNAVYKDNASSMEALNAKGDVLDRTLYSQREKVEKLRAALQNSAESYGESDKRTMNWQKSLNLAEAEVAKTESAIKKNREEMEKASKSTDDATKATDNFAKSEENASQKSMGAGSVIDQLTGKLGIKLPEGVIKSVDKLGSLSGAALGAAAGFAAVAAAVVDVEKKLMALTKQSAEAADEILTLEMTTSLTAETIQGLKYASELVDTSFDTISGSLTKLTNNMQSARDGNAALSQTFEDFGITITNTDGSLRRAEDVFYELIDALGTVESVTDRNAIAMDIFGKSAQDLNPLIIAGSSALKGYAKEAKDVGYIMDNDMLDALLGVDDAYVRLEKTQDAVKNQIAAEFAPASEKALTDYAGFIKKAGDAFVKSGLVDGFGVLLTTVSDILGPLGDFTEWLSGPLGEALKIVAGGLALIATTLQTVVGLVTLIPELLSGKKLSQTNWSIGLGVGSTPNSYQKWLNSVEKGWKYDNSTNSYYIPGEYNHADLYKKYTDSGFYGSFEAWKQYNGYNAIGDSNWRGGWTWLGENGPELVKLPTGSQIMNNQESRNAGGDTYYFTIDAHSVDDIDRIVRMFKSYTTRKRMG